MFGKCKTCIEKDNRIDDLKNQIEFLRKLSAPVYNDPINAEMNKVLEGASSPIIEYNDHEIADKAAIKAEEDAILSGNY